MSLRGMHYGEARVVIAVDATGRLTDSLAIGYTDPMFAEAALAAARTWTYEPARVQGEARAGRAELLFVFKADVVSVQSIDENYYKRVFTALRFCGLSAEQIGQDPDTDQYGAARDRARKRRPAQCHGGVLYRRERGGAHARGGAQGRG